MHHDSNLYSTHMVQFTVCCEVFTQCLLYMEGKQKTTQNAMLSLSVKIIHGLWMVLVLPYASYQQDLSGLDKLGLTAYLKTFSALRGQLYQKENYLFLIKEERRKARKKDRVERVQSLTCHEQHLDERELRYGI